MPSLAISCPRIRATALPIALLAAAAVVPAARADDSVCEGFTQKGQRITRLGGANAFSKTPASSPADLLTQLEAQRADVAALLRDHDLDHLTDALYAAVKSGEGLSERDLERGESFEWMALRKGGTATAEGPVCFAAKKPYGVYQIRLTEEDVKPAEAVCKLTATASCGDRTISVNAAGSSPGVKVTSGGKTLISGGSTSWKGAYENPYGDGQTFTATAEARGTAKVTTHTFVIPKICLNLAYAGSKSADTTGPVDRCEATARVETCTRPASCTLTVDPAQVKRKETTTVSASGHHPNGLEVKIVDAEGAPAQAMDAQGNALSEMTTLPQSISFKKRGDYTLRGTATNEAGETADCEAQITVGRVATARSTPSGKWIVRGFGLRVDPDDDVARESAIRPNGVSERSTLGLDSGDGLGFGVEYLFTDRVGLEGSVLYADMEAAFTLDLDSDWERDEDDASFLALTVGPNFHLTAPDSKADVYIGPFVGMVDLGDVDFRTLGENQSRELDDEFVFGAQLGVDIPIGAAGWAIHLGTRYIDMAAEIEAAEDVEGPEIDLNPLLFEAGFAYRF